MLTILCYRERVKPIQITFHPYNFIYSSSIPVLHFYGDVDGITLSNGHCPWRRIWWTSLEHITQSEGTENRWWWSCLVYNNGQSLSPIIILPEASEQSIWMWMGWYTWWAYILIECFGIKCPDRRTEYGGGGGQMDMIFTSQWTCSGWLLNALVQPIYNCDILETIDHLIKYPEYWSMFIESSFVITVLGK